MYHHVYEATTGDLGTRFPDSYLHVDQLRRQLDRLLGLGLKAITLAEALKAPARRRRIVLTFDDGGESFLHYAWPELRRRGMTATLFAVSGELGGFNRWDDVHGERRERLLDTEELRSLSAEGVEIGCHSHSHATLTRCPEPQLDVEIGDSRRRLEDAIDGEVLTFCYPYGAVNPAVRQRVEDSGYLGAASIFGHPYADPGDAFAIGRMIIRPDESPFELGLKAKGRYPLWSRLPRLGLLPGLRRHSRRRA